MSLFKNTIVYISGPMTGLPDYNRPAFFAAEKWLKAQGGIVLNPAYSPDGLPSHDAYMEIALAMLKQAQVVFLLPNYRNSKGVAMELTLAEKMGIPVRYAEDHALDVLLAPQSALSTQVGGDHYKTCAIQPVQFIEANRLEFLEGCVVKRVTRHDKPTGKGKQDIDKAIHELTLLRELRYEKAVTF